MKTVSRTSGILSGTLAGILPVLALLIPGSLTRAATDVRFVPASGPLGTSLTVETSPALPNAPASVAGPDVSGRDFSLEWHRYLENPIYTSVGVNIDFTLAGNYLNPPRQAEEFWNIGDGTPRWVSPGTELYVDVSHWGDIMAALDANSADSTVTVLRLNPANGAAIWRTTLHACRPLPGDGWAYGKGIQVDDSGTTIAVVVNRYEPGGILGRLYLFNPASPAPIADVPLGGAASAIASSTNGRYVAVCAWPNIYVYDRTAGAMRWSGPAYAGNDALAISADGCYVAWGWANLYVREWNGATYQALWQMSKAGYYLTECAMNTWNDDLAVAWYRANTYDESILETYTLPAQTAYWTYNYSSGPLARGDADGGESDLSARGLMSPAEKYGRPADCRRAQEALPNPVDIVSEMVFEGGVLAAASWGGTFPEIHVFGFGAGLPPVTLDTPGSMFDIDLAFAWDANLPVAACGKHVHAGTSGRGADLYLLLSPGGMGVEEGAAPALSGGPWVVPNPSSGPRRIDFRLAQNGPARLDVHDASGRLVARLLDGTAAAGPHSLFWNGRTDDGRALANGTYFMTLRAGGVKATSRLISVR